MTKDTAVRELYEAARFSLAVHIEQGCYDLSERMAVEKLTRALAGVARYGVLQGEQSDGEVDDGRVS